LEAILFWGEGGGKVLVVFANLHLGNIRKLKIDVLVQNQLILLEFVIKENSPNSQFTKIILNN
jgi:hypothetical protein